MNEPSRVKWGNTSAMSSGGGDAITRLTVPTGVTVKSLEVCPSVAEYTIRLPSGDQRGFGSSSEPSVTGAGARDITRASDCRGRYESVCGYGDAGAAIGVHDGIVGADVAPLVSRNGSALEGASRVQCGVSRDGENPRRPPGQDCERSGIGQIQLRHAHLKPTSTGYRAEFDARTRLAGLIC